MKLVNYTGLVVFSFVLKVSGVVIHVKLDEAVNFHLPTPSLCGPYSLTNNYDLIVINVNSSHQSISTPYLNRSTVYTLTNGSLVFTLHHVTRNDLGMYSLRHGVRLIQIPGCDHYYELKQEQASVKTVLFSTATTRAYVGTEWGDWSDCSVVCGDGTRYRQRQDGSDTETAACSYSCDWSNWSRWSTCGGEDCIRGRQRVCMNTHTLKTEPDYRKCPPGERIQYSNCRPEECGATAYAVNADWSPWYDWTSCSQTCGPGTKSRSRDCLDARSALAHGRCAGNKTEITTCELVSCNKAAPGTLQGQDYTVKLPLSTIVGGAAVVFIFILIIVIVVLVIKLKNRRPREVNKDEPQVRKTSKRQKKYRKPVSVAPPSSHCYDEINDDDVLSYANGDVKRSERMSVLTIDNPYVALPLSASPTNKYANESVTYNNDQSSVFMYGDTVQQDMNSDSTFSGQGLYPQNVPRHMSVDSVGYLMPGTLEERERARMKKYSKNKK